MSRIQALHALVLVGLAGMAIAAGIGCGTDASSPVASENDLRGSTVVIAQPVPDFTFLEDVWTTVYATPYVTRGSNVSWTFVSQEVTAAGQYGGVNNVGEAFTLDLSEVDYYDAAALVATDPSDTTLSTVVPMFNISLSIVRGQYAGPNGALDLYGTVRSYDYGGTRYHYYAPLSYDVPMQLVEVVTAGASATATSAPAGAPRLPWETNPRHSKVASGSGCDGSWKGCNQNSARPSKPSVSCPSGQHIKASCESDCSDGYDADIDAAIEKGCTSLCQAADGLSDDVNQCFVDAGVGEAIGIGVDLLEIASGPYGLAATLVGEAISAAALYACVDGAESDYLGNVAQIQADYTSDVNQAKDDYKSCAHDCCVDSPISISEFYRLIGN